jgi:hypothetical protein
MTKTSESIPTSDLIIAFTGIGHKKFVGKNWILISQIKTGGYFFRWVTALFFAAGKIMRY